MMKIRLEWDASAGWEALRRARAVLGNPEELHAVVETAAEKAVKDHLTNTHAARPNRLGGVSTGYWKSVIESTTSESDGGGATVTLKHKGVRMKYYGGIIRPSGRPSEVTGKPIRNLTIPVTAAAHGRTIMDLGGGKAFHAIYPGVYKRTAAPPSTSDPLYFILRKSVKITADPTVLPPDEAVAAECLKALNKLLNGGGADAP
ncbi:MAG: hypothetical protein V4726_00830 [Verrucomicrobiota bacterium]